MSSFQKAGIEAAIPHREPFLLVDEVLSMDAQSIVAAHTVPADHQVFRGHFPEHPVYPGVLACESIFQAGAILLSSLTPPATTPSVPVLTRILGAKFKKVIKPGDRIDITVTLKEQMGGAFFLRGVARVGGQVSVDVEFACARAETGKLA